MNAPCILELAKFSQGCKLEGPVSAVGIKSGNGYGEQFSISAVPETSLVVMPGAKLREYHADLDVATEQHPRVEFEFVTLRSALEIYAALVSQDLLLQEGPGPNCRVLEVHKDCFAVASRDRDEWPG